MSPDTLAKPAVLQTASTILPDGLPQALIEDAPFPIDVTNEDGCYLVINDAFESYLGVSRPEIIGKAAGDFFATDVAEAAAKHHRQVWSQGEPSEFEQAIERDGCLIHFLFIRYPLHDRNGDVVAVGTIWRNISERRVLQDSLDDSLERMKLITSTTIDGIYDWDLDSGLLWHSPGFKALLGYSEAEFGQDLETWTSWLHPDDRDAALRTVERARINVSHFQCEYRIRTKHDAYLWVADHGEVLADAAGIAVRMVGSIHDISRLKTAEQAVRDKEKNLAAAQRIAGMGSWEWDLVSGEITWSDNLCRIFTLEPGKGLDLEGYYAVVHPRDRERVRDTVESAAASAEPFTLDYRIVRSDGGVAHLHEQSEVVDREAGKAIRMRGILRDVTEQRALEEARRESEAKYQNVVRNIPGVIYRTGADGWSLEYVSDAIETYTGLPSGHFIEKGAAGFQAVIDPEDRDRICAAVAEALETGSPLDVEYRIRHTNGLTVWVHERAQAPTGEDGARWLDGIILDNSDQRRAAEALSLASKELRNGEMRFRTVVENVPGAIYRCVNDANWSMLYMSSPIEAITGYPASDIIENAVRSYESIIHEADRHLVRDTVEQAIESGESFTVEYRINHADGDFRWVREQGRGVLDEGGNLRWLDGVVSDITEQRRLNDALYDSETRFRSLVQNVPGVIYRQRNDANWTMLVCGPGVEAISGYPAEEFIDNNVRTWASVVFSEDLPDIDETVQAALAVREPYVLDYRIRHKDGSTRHLYEKGQGVFGDTGELQFLDGAIFDVTARKQAEEAIQRSNEELQQFAYVASHDLQEPLRMVGSYCQLLERRYADKLDSDAQEFIAYAVDGANRMQTLINDLLSYSRVGTRGKEFGTIDLEETLDTALKNLEVLCRETDARISRDALPTVCGESGQLVQLFQNLIGNAIKFCRETTPAIHIGASKESGEWRVSVRDNGIGIGPQYQEKIFGIFQRLHTREEFQGTGIGLAVCRKIVERHGGHIEVESEPGQGSIFTFTMPDIWRDPEND